MYEAIVFDLDGTLLDTLDDLANSTNATLAAHGLPTRTREEICSFVGDGMRVLLERASGFRDERVDGLLAEFKAHYAVHCKEKTKPYDGVTACLQGLREKGIKTAVLSNKADGAVKSLVETFFSGLLDEAAGENESMGVRKKPAPDGLFTVIERLGVKKSKTLYVGDSDVDIATARNAGVACVCVTWGFRDRAFLTAHGATTLVDTPQEILSLV